MNPQSWLTTGAILAALAVGTGAYGAHGLQARLAQTGVDAVDVRKRIENYETAVRYQMYHALGLLVVGLLAARQPSAWLTAAGMLFVLGTFLFSGSLYAIVLTGNTKFGAVAPVGGLCLIVGWVVLALAVARPSAS